MDIKVDAHTVIVFDLDDTLYNEMEYLRSAYMEIAKRLDADHWRMLFARMYSLFRSKEDVFAFVSAEYGVAKQELLDAYRTHYPTLRPFDGVLETLQAIKAKEGKIGVLTDGRSSTQRNKLKALGIIDFLDMLVISEEIGSEKPDERNYIKIEQTFPKCAYLYMSDNLGKDFITPNQRGWQTLGLIDNGLNVHHDGHIHFDKRKLPQNFVLTFKEIHIVGLM